MKKKYLALVLIICLSSFVASIIPIVQTVTITPSIGYSNDTLIGSCEGYADTSNNITFEYNWYLNDIIIDSGIYGQNILDGFLSIWEPLEFNDSATSSAVWRSTDTDIPVFYDGVGGFFESNWTEGYAYISNDYTLPIVYWNYTKRPFAINGTMIELRYKTSDQVNHGYNITLPEDCLTPSKTQFRLTFDPSGSTSVEVDCMNSTDWDNIFNSTSISPLTLYLKNTRLLWKLVDYNLTYFSNISYNIANLSDSFLNINDNIIFSCRAYDNESISEWYNSSSLVISNYIPLIQTVNITPFIAYTNDSLQGDCNVTDSDHENLRYDWFWYLNNSVFLSGNNLDYFTNETSYFYNVSDFTNNVSINDFELGNDSDWSTNIILNTTYCESSCTAYVYENLTFPEDSFDISLNIKCGGNRLTGAGSDSGCTVYFWNFTNSSWSVLNSTSNTSIYNFNILEEGIYNHKVNIKTSIYRAGFYETFGLENSVGSNYYESNISYGISDDMEGLLINLDNLSSDNISKGDEWIFSCKGFDNYNNTGWTNSSTLTILNTIPTTPSGSSLNAADQVGESLVVTGAGSTDVDSGDSITYYYEFRCTNDTGLLLQSKSTDDSWTINNSCGETKTVYVNIWANDTDSESINYETESVVILNTIPTVPSGSSLNVANQVGENLVATGAGSTDVDSGDSIAYYYEFRCTSDSGLVLQSKSVTNNWTINSSCVHDNIYVNIWGNDGTSDSSTYETETVAIINTIPTVPSGSSLNAANQIGESLVSTGAGSTDVDDDSITYYYEFRCDGVGGTLLQSKSTDNSWTINNSCGKTKTIYNLIWGNDGTSDSSTYETETVAILNTIPTDPSGSSLNAANQVGESLVATGSGSSDVDSGDSITYYYEFRCGSDSGPIMQSWSTDSSWTITDSCSHNTTYVNVWANDGSANSSTYEAESIFIINTQPTVPIGSSLSAADQVGESLVATGAGSTDIDSDSLTYYYEFRCTSDSGLVLQSKSIDTSWTINSSCSHDTVYVNIWSNDTFSESSTYETEIKVVINTVPTTPSGSSLNAANQVNESLVATGAGSTDVDSDSLTYYYEFRCGSDSGPIMQSKSTDTSWTISDSCAHNITFINIWSNDTFSESSSYETENVTVLNTNPLLLSNPILNDTTPYTNDTISCSNGTYYDIDTDSKDGQVWRWKDNGTLISGQSSSTLSLKLVNLTHDDIISCDTRVNDSYGWSSWYSVTSNATIQNSLPIISDVIITPASVDTSSTLTCNWTYFDLDNDLQNITTIKWYVAGALVETDTYDGTLPTLTSSNFVKDQIVNCTVLGNDGRDNSSIYVTNNITIGNIAPTFSSVTLASNTSQKADTLTCMINGRNDLDGDGMTNYYKFLDTDNSTILQNWSTTNTFDCSANINCTKDDLILCSGMVGDGEDNSTIKNDTVLIINTIPVAQSVFISPLSPTDNINISCNYTFYDIDSDLENNTYYTWYLNNTLHSNTTQIIDKNYLSAGDTWKCGIIVYDGFSNSTPINSTPVVLDSSAPTVIAVTNDGEIDIGSIINFTITWSDPDLPGNGPYTHYVCNSSSVSASGCDDTELCSIEDNTSTSSCSYTPPSSLPNSNTAYIFTVDNLNQISNIEPEVWLLNHPPTAINTTVNVTTTGSTNTFTCNLFGESDSDSDSLTNYYTFLSINDTILQAESTSSTFITSSGEGTHNDTITCRARTKDNTLYSGYFNTSSHLIINNITFSDTKYLNNPTSIYVTIINSSSVAANITLKNPFNTIISDLEMTYSSSLNKWGYTFSPNQNGEWTINSIIAIQDDGMGYLFKGDGDIFNVTTAPLGGSSSGGSGSSRVQSLKLAGNLTGFCGDNICQAGENPNNCWNDCKVNYDTLVTCIWDDNIECNWSQTWFPMVLLVGLMMIGLTSYYYYDINPKRKRK